MIFFTADHHFGHENIIKYVDRPFHSVEEMDAEMIRRWNSKVKHGDVVYHLGDFTLGGLQPFMSSYRQLNGAIFFILGGHDHRWHDALRGDDVNILSSLYIDEDMLPARGGYSVPLTMCHYPLFSWERSHYGAPHLHGHCHGTIGKSTYSGDVQLPPGQTSGKRVDVGVDCWDFAPVSLDELKKYI